MFRNRFDAGNQLARLLDAYAAKDTYLVAIPRGGIEIAHPISLQLRKPLDVIIPCKIPSPDNPELGVGAVTIEGEIEINQELVSQLGLSSGDVEELVRPVKQEIERRLASYRGKRPSPKLGGKHVIIVDDGLATGYTMMVAVKSVRSAIPAEIVVAVPVSPRSTYDRIRPLADEVVVLHLASDHFYSVSSFYQDFRDLPDGQLVKLLEECSRAQNKAQAGN